MRFTPLKKLIVIFLLTALSLYLSLPKSFPIRFELSGKKVDYTFMKPNLNLFSDRINAKINSDLVLGLDLAGGSHLVFEVGSAGLTVDDKKEAIESLKSVIEKRVNLFGISEPNVQTSSFEGKDRIIVELPGVKDVNEAVSIVGKTAQLIFVEIGSEEKPGVIPTDLTGAD